MSAAFSNLRGHYVCRIMQATAHGRISIGSATRLEAHPPAEVIKGIHPDQIGWE
jgi:hypothetical protein